MKPFAYYRDELNTSGELIDREYNGINQFGAGQFGKPLYTAEQLEAAVLAEREKQTELNRIEKIMCDMWGLQKQETESLTYTYEQVKAHIKVATITEREACAMVCEQIDTAAFGDDRPAPNDCAAAIRARGNHGS